LCTERTPAINPFEKSSHFDRHFFPFLPSIHTEVKSRVLEIP
jgi:hypothetical protein